MTYFTASISTIALRFFLMMAIVIGSFFSGFPILAILALPVFLSALTGISFTTKTNTRNVVMGKLTSSENKMNTAA